jgi:hypothetical protein
METFYQVSESAVYRKVSDQELMVIQVESGKMSYYSAETETFLNYFRDPGSLGGFFRHAAIPEESTERTVLTEILRGLVDSEILIQADPAHGSDSDRPAVRYAGLPRFLRHSEKSLSEVAVALMSTSLTSG